MVKGMTPHEFEQLVVEYGSDLANWPAREQSRAKAFLATDEGMDALVAEKALDGLLAKFSAEADTAFDPASDPFLARLADIPVYNKQAFEPSVAPRQTTTGWLAQLSATLGFLSPRAIVSQAAAAVAVLGVGMVVGMSSVSETVEYDEYDISTAWFVGQDNYTELDLDEGS